MMMDRGRGFNFVIMLKKGEEKKQDSYQNLKTKFGLTDMTTYHWQGRIVTSEKFSLTSKLKQGISEELKYFFSADKTRGVMKILIMDKFF